MKWKRGPFLSSAWVRSAVSRAAGRSLRPSSASMSGTRNTRPQIMAETGLPGSPSTRVAPSRPNSRGFPGRIATFQKSIDVPRAFRAGATRS